jgi:hypothetical protein
MSPNVGPRTGRTQLIATRLPHELVARLDRMAARLSLPGLTVTRAEALRAAATAGLEVLERQAPELRPEAAPLPATEPPRAGEEPEAAPEPPRLELRPTEAPAPRRRAKATAAGVRWTAEVDGRRFLVVPSESRGWWAAGEKTGRKERVIGTYRTADKAKAACQAQTPLTLHWAKVEPTPESTGQ